MDADETCAAFDLLGLFDRILLPRQVLEHLDVNSRKILRVCCKRLRDEVDAYNIRKLSDGPPGLLARRYPALRRLAFGANEPREVAALLRSHLPSLAPALACLDFWAYYASVSADLWSLLVAHCPPALTLRLNLNESLLRRMEVDHVCAALDALQQGRPGLVVELNAAHSFFGFRATDARTLAFLRDAGYVRSLGFSIGLLRGRELQNERFFSHLVPPPGTASGGSGQGGGEGGGAAADALEALSLTHYESEERPAVGPLLADLHLLRRLASLTLDCEISIQELAPLAACAALTRLTVDFLVAAPRAVTAAAGRRLPPPAPPAAPLLLSQIRALALGAESHPATPLGGVFPSLTELVSERATRRVGVYDVFHCGLMLGGGAASSRLTRLTLATVLTVQAAGALAAVAALTSLEFTHADNASTAAVLAAAASLPSLRRLALWDHEDADEYLSLRPLLQPPAAAEAPVTALERHPPEAAAAPFGPGTSPAWGKWAAAAARGGLADTETAAVTGPLVLPHLEEVELKATSPDFFDELLSLLAPPHSHPVAATAPSSRAGYADGASMPTSAAAAADAAGAGAVAAAAAPPPPSPLLCLGPGRLARARLDACYDPPLLDVAALGRLLAALGPQLRSAVVSGWATPGSEVALLSLGGALGRPDLRVEYEYPIL
ncbi:hypothetical protein GPECTOR_4g798 [Gonium pectorale]|uniref:Uncharacterized protein n=1 Tax=Gonium pectorale TaxID=33097 RepID=A0A150GY19_GONPE|nr:hypothetical protein GPECTOR_4g798 [Gonium pectorale]|eukprot:KXZ54729.1 hypothetical protein GPECTOR_4g798 [Gonium pectorale]